MQVSGLPIFATLLSIVSLHHWFSPLLHRCSWFDVIPLSYLCYCALCSRSHSKVYTDVLNCFMLSSSSSTIPGLSLRVLVHFVQEVEAGSSVFGGLSPAPSDEQSFLSPLYFFGTSVENQLLIDTQIHSQGLCYFSRTYVLIFMLVSCFLKL